MTETSTTVEVAESKTTTNYGVYDAPDGDEKQEIVGMYISDGITDQLGEYASVEISDEDAVMATLDRVTSGYGVFSTEADAIESMYVAHALLETLFDEYDSEEGVEAIGVSLSSSSEEAFEEALDAVTVTEDETEQEANALLADESDDDSEDEEDDTPEITDEELNLVEE